jgi:hypothetical protein
MLPLVCRLNGLDNCSGYAEKPVAAELPIELVEDGSGTFAPPPAPGVA